MINVFSPNIRLSDIISVSKNLFKTYISGTSPVVKEFEKNFAKYIGKKYAVSVSNGSVALDLALQSLNLEEGDEVIIPSFTIISCLSAVMRTPAKPVFCDVDEYSWNTNLEHIEKIITSKTKAIILVHTYGLAAEVHKIKELCNKKDIFLIEDSAEAHGQSINGKMCGSFGDISTFSFYANKHVTTGEGGIILTDSKVFYDTLIQMRNLDFDNSKRFIHNNLYWNYRLSGLQASLGISQLKKITLTIKQKINQAKIYNELLSSFEEIIQLPLENNKFSTNHYWVYGIVLKNKNIRNDLIAYLSSKGIETRPFFYPLHLQPALGGKYQNSKCKVSEDLGENGLYLPLGSRINKKKQKFIVENLLNGIRHITAKEEN